MADPTDASLDDLRKAMKATCEELEKATTSPFDDFFRQSRNLLLKPKVKETDHAQ